MKENFNFHGDEHDKEIDKILDEFREDKNLNSDDKYKSVGKYDFDMFMPKSTSSTDEENYNISSADSGNISFGVEDDDTFLDDDFVIKPHDNINTPDSAEIMHESKEAHIAVSYTHLRCGGNWFKRRHSGNNNQRS